MAPPQASELIPRLREAGLLASGNPHVTSLSGGVSSDIVLVEDGARRFVVKRALPKLRVKDDWFADVSRNRVEQDWLDYAGRVAPDAVPLLLHADRSEAWFAMEYLGEGWANWKSELLAGRADPAVARRAGDTLGRLHAASWDNPRLKERFSTLANFTELRIAPYLLATAERVPGVALELRAEAGRLSGCAEALVHGDFSPKNLLVSPGRLVVLDAEVAWYGDPVFDVAFLVCHLLLKGLHHAGAPEPVLALIGEAWRAYGGALGVRAGPALEARTARLALCLVLARIHGKSPVEYLGGPGKAFASAFAIRHLPRPQPTLETLTGAWRAGLAQLSHP